MTLFDVGETQHSWARLSPCGTYRYVLGRRWAEGNPLTWVMLNPSTADAAEDDPTIRRVVRFSRDAGYAAAVVYNLFALRATDPTELGTHPDPVGPENDDFLSQCHLAWGLPVVAAWGAKASRERVADVIAGPLAIADLRCLGKTKGGHPRHPLYVPATQTLDAWEPT